MPIVIPKREPSTLDLTMPTDKETVPCRLCNTPTPMLGTELCDRCWELKTRIRSNPEIARAILAAFDAKKEPCQS